ncbi:MAG TPA: sensor domain-containing diguanylate cyclase, partial [Azospira sp.]|nr:sensor domain-containing diguanylate cyclase [Azospira sp.]
SPHPDQLMAIIRMQTEIAKLGPDLGGVIAYVSEQAQALAGADGAVIELAEGEDMVYRASSGIAENQLGLRLKRSTSLSGLCVHTGVAMNCDDSESDPRVDREACRKVGLRSMLVVPLQHNGTVVGVLKVLGRAPRAFAPPHAVLLGLISEMVAAAMFHAAHHQADELLYRATHDPLTGLANRALFLDRLRNAIARAGREGKVGGILMMDMDGLKQINDNLGHRAGDAALAETAMRLRQDSRTSDTVARLGGDEFAVLLMPVAGRESVLASSQRLADQVSRPFAFEGRPLQLQTSVGAALFPEDGCDIGNLMERADQAMYAAKRQRKGLPAAALMH